MLTPPSSAPASLARRIREGGRKDNRANPDSAEPRPAPPQASPTAPIAQIHSPGSLCARRSQLVSHSGGTRTQGCLPACVTGACLPAWRGVLGVLVQVPAWAQLPLRVAGLPSPTLWTPLRQTPRRARVSLLGLAFKATGGPLALPQGLRSANWAAWFFPSGCWPFPCPRPLCRTTGHASHLPPFGPTPDPKEQVGSKTHLPFTPQAWLPFAGGVG